MYDLDELKEGGFIASEMKSSGYNIPVLRAVPYSEDDLSAPGAFTAKEIEAAAAKIALTSAKDLRISGYTVTELLAGGYTSFEIKKGGYNISYLKANGFSTDQQLLDLVFSQRELDAAAAKGNLSLIHI